MAETSQKGLQLMQSGGSPFCSSSGKSQGQEVQEKPSVKASVTFLLAAVHFRPRKPPVSFTVLFAFCVSLSL